ncbi:hypothetical protein [Nakamurella leprariae]|uniref:Uncharacterized protein n=1 Tax=Nakamurella leprariae TaxID=2803911 RepID=A0A939BYK1_9ACTN|nr:hypothetical protein [Nakamurella leprariae]MBM9469628.1 hypothetical protein [Nakamurella leprariae]
MTKGRRQAMKSNPLRQLIRWEVYAVVTVVSAVMSAVFLFAVPQRPGVNVVAVIFAALAIIALVYWIVLGARARRR